MTSGANTGRAPRTSSDGLVLALACLAQFMVVLDVSIVNVALPSIRADLGFSATGLQWVVNAYTLTFAGFLLLGGRAADLFGRRRIFMLGLAIFTLASLVGGLAQNEATLLAARAAQGVGGAVLSPATLTILTTTFTTPASRAKALGTWSAVAGAGGAAGGLVGGLLTDLVNWRWILFVNIPIGVLGLVGARAVLRESRAEETTRHLDVTGAVLVTGGLVSLVYGIVSTETYGWTAARTLVPLLAGVVVLAVFVYQQARIAKAPLMPLELFKVRSVASANVVMFFVGASIFATWYFLSLYLQNVRGFSPLEAGFAFLPQALSIILGAQISSRTVSRIGARTLLLIGPSVSALGLLLLTQIDATTPYFPALIGPSVLVTLGVGLAFTPVTLTATSGVPPRQAGFASGLVNTTRQVGGSIGLAVLATAASSRTMNLVGDAGAEAGGSGAAPSPQVAEALTSGYAFAFGVAAVFAVLAALTALAVPGQRSERESTGASDGVGAPADAAV